MTIASELRTDFNNFVTAYGKRIRLKYYTSTTSGATTYDDETYLTASGTEVYCYGQHGNISKAMAGVDKKFLEQGLITFDDSILYIPGSFSITTYTKIGLGSPVDNEYELVPKIGDQKYEIGATTIYHKMYIRQLPTGSWLGEI